jgi:hypothetical protein
MACYRVKFTVTFTCNLWKYTLLKLWRKGVCLTLPVIRTKPIHTWPCGVLQPRLGPRGRLPVRKARGRTSSEAVIEMQRASAVGLLRYNTKLYTALYLHNMQLQTSGPVQAYHWIYLHTQCRIHSSHQTLFSFYCRHRKLSPLKSHVLCISIFQL